jgi:nucleoside 2-deoxyribosyltransferase
MSSFKKTVYLAGAISFFHNTNCPERATGWRNIAENYLSYYDIKCFNPCKCEGFSEDMIVKQNMYYLNQCDIILVNLDMINDSVGTIFELTEAKHRGKPIIAFGKSYWRERPHMKYLIDTYFDTFEDALDNIVTAYRQ